MIDRPIPVQVPPDAVAFADAKSLEAELLADIPLARAMALSITAYDGESLSLGAPLAPNVNDKGCVFGGSLVSLMTLAGWGLLKLGLHSRGIAADIYVKDSTVRYLAPVWQDFGVIARVDRNESLEAFFDAVNKAGKGRISTSCHVPLPDDKHAATLCATFVAILGTRKATPIDAQSTPGELP